jgi:signal transduction histidine kinase
VGIAPEHAARLFQHGFTTRPNGHGFGLHNSVLTAQELGGALRFESAGLGLGATFILDLPSSPPERSTTPGRAHRALSSDNALNHVQELQWEQ